MAGADPETVSERALERGKDQLGTLGSGNHFLEIEVVEELFDEKAAAAFGLVPGPDLRADPQRLPGLRLPGLRRLPGPDGQASSGEIGIALPDRQLACARLNSARGREYLAAMACAANYAWANRQILMHRTREIFEKTLGDGAAGAGDAASLRCLPQHRQDRDASGGRERRPASASTGRGRPGPFRRGTRPFRRPTGSVGQPVLIPGDMGTGSYVLAGTERAFTETFREHLSWRGPGDEPDAGRQVEPRPVDSEGDGGPRRDRHVLRRRGR